jgi:vancomycin resistance protein YoaR
MLTDKLIHTLPVEQVPVGYDATIYQSSYEAINKSFHEFLGGIKDVAL